MTHLLVDSRFACGGYGGAFCLDVETLLSAPQQACCACMAIVYTETMPARHHPYHYVPVADLRELELDNFDPQAYETLCGLDADRLFYSSLVDFFAMPVHRCEACVARLATPAFAMVVLADSILDRGRRPG